MLKHQSPVFLETFREQPLLGCQRSHRLKVVPHDPGCPNMAYSRHQVGQIGGVDLGQTLVREMASVLGPAPNQGDAVRIEENRGQAAHQVGPPVDPLAVDEKAPLPAPIQAEFAGEPFLGFILHLQPDVKVLLLEPDEFLGAAAAVGYVLGMFPSADLAARAAAGETKDLRTEGSGNPGGLNTLQVVGTGWGVAVMALTPLRPRQPSCGLLTSRSTCWHVDVNDRGKPLN